MNNDEEKNMFQLTSRQSYLSMSRFVKNMHDLGWTQLGGLVGSMALIDGMPMDVALADDWLDAVRYVLNKGEEAETSRRLNDEQAYAAMFSFLEQMRRERREDIGSLVLDLESADGFSIDEHIISAWGNAFEFAFSGGKTLPVTLVKDGLVIELHRHEGARDSFKSGGDLEGEGSEKGPGMPKK